MEHRHALYLRWIADIAAKQGVSLRPEIDEVGSYTGRLNLAAVDVQLVVPPPPEDWSGDEEFCEYCYEPLDQHSPNERQSCDADLRDLSERP